MRTILARALVCAHCAFVCALVSLVSLVSVPALAQQPPNSQVPPPPPVRYQVPETRVASVGFVAQPSVETRFDGEASSLPKPDTATPPPPAPRSVQVDLGVATEFPISMGGYIGIELPARLLVQVGAGVMPGPYASAVNGVLTGVGAYDSTVAGFIQNAISNSFVLRLSGGWRPFTDHGFEILGGYTLMTLGGSATEGDIINAVLTEAHSSQRVTAGSGVTIPLSATLHNVHVTLGWRWLLASDHLVIRASLSYMQCLAANVGVSLPSAPGMEAAVNQQLNAIVSPYLTSYVKTPLLGLSAAYRF